MKKIMQVFACVLGLLGVASAGIASDASKVQQIQFKKGESGTTIKGVIKGDENVDYKLTANKGQKLEVIFNTKHNVYFNIIPPGNHVDAIFSGAMKGDRFEGELPVKGTYTIRVYQMGLIKIIKPNMNSHWR